MKRSADESMRSGSTSSALHRLLPPLAVCSAAWAAGPALADVLGENVDVYATMSVLQDDNLFRRDVDVREEARYRVGAGLAAELQMGQQELDLDLRVHDNRFEDADELDYVGASGELAFAWKVGRRLDGAVEYTYLRDLTRFEQFRVIQKDVTTFNDGGASVGYFVLPRLQLRGEIRASDWRHSSADWQGSELEETAVGVSLMYRTRPGTFIGIGTIRTEGEYPHRSVRAGAVADNAYDQTSPGVIVEWNPGGKTSLDMRIGRTSREQEHLSDRDFDATTGDLSVAYALTQKTQMSLAYSRGIRSIDEAVARAALVDTFEFSPAWYASRNFALSAHVIFRRQDFIGVDGLPDEGRVDEELHLETRVFYTLRDRLALEFGIGRGDRESTRPGLDYDYWQGSVGVRVSL